MRVLNANGPLATTPTLRWNTDTVPVLEKFKASWMNWVALGSRNWSETAVLVPAPESTTTWPEKPKTLSAAIPPGRSSKLKNMKLRSIGPRASNFRGVSVNAP